MFESISQLLAARSIANWKLLVKKRDLVTASFPALSGDSHSSIQKTHQEVVYHLHLYKTLDNPEKKMCGQTVLEWDETWDAARVEALIEDAWKDLDAQPDPWFPLEIVQVPSSQPSLSSLSKKPQLDAWVTPLQEALWKASDHMPFVLQNEFIQLEREEKMYRDSFHRELVDVGYRGYADIILLPRDRPDVQPRSGEISFGEFTPHLLASFVKECGELCLGGLQAVAFQPKGTFQILIHGFLVRELMGYLLRQLSGLNLYTGLSQNRPGTWLFGREPGGDSLTVEALPNLYNSPQNAFFDDQGVILSHQLLVEDSRVKKILTSQETAHYLQLPLTGMNTNFSVAPGTLDLTKIQGNLLDLLHFRTCHIDEATGQFFAESELGYFFENGKRTPVTNVHLQGNLQDLLTNCRLSREITTWENYEGPECLLVSSDYLQAV